MKTFINRFFSKFGLSVSRLPKGPPNPIELWNTDKDFLKIYSKISAYTVVDQKRCFMLYQSLRHTSSLVGDVAEISVFRGGTAKLIAILLAEMSQGKSLHLFDTFSGMPKVDTSRDLHVEGDFKKTSLEDVQKLFFGFSTIQFHPGYFPDTAQTIKSKKFSFVHIDVDIYKSVLDGCKFFYSIMTPGGVIIFDDYGFVSCPGARQAVDEFFHDKPEYPMYLPTGQCLVVKQ